MMIRSLLFVPAEEKMLKKVGETEADAYIIDLEDSIAADDKDVALGRTIKLLQSQKEQNIYIRINKERRNLEARALQSCDVGFMLPKIESDADYSDIADVLRDHKIIALIETPRALINVNSIASLSWVSALAFGAEDFTTATNMLNSSENLTIAKNLLVFAAKAYEKQVYDTPCFQLRDDESLGKELQQAKDLGFDGKLAIHPDQVEKINRFFEDSDQSYIKHIIDEYELSGQAVCEIDGRVYEELHIKRLRRALAEAKEG